MGKPLHETNSSKVFGNFAKVPTSGVNQIQIPWMTVNRSCFAKEEYLIRGCAAVCLIAEKGNALAVWRPLRSTGAEKVWDKRENMSFALNSVEISVDKRTQAKGHF